ncbi:hypothetical protein F4556_004976 [Kitasatospora gansuensis]|uniref:Uncharacterized protein n=1 Tax=Kitasatospora gansuensis TaxID=258050 RepID=A0A7W7WJL9_9ACTN|nr:hypothetical protein [Kitasatospora gansuensis]MBB4949441.1 hypothetical protein [Kitasatospora gansuensis]
MINLEELVTRVHTPEVRQFVRDAYRAYASGIHRAAIVLTWTAVCADVMAKALVLADDGEPEAKEITKKVLEAQTLAASTDPKDRKSSIEIMGAVERGLVDTALKLELIDASQRIQLDRLHEDRNQSAHPSLRPLGEPYEPTGDYARAHLMAALDALLIHPPSQGRKVLNSFMHHVADPAFILHRGHLVHTYFDRVRPSARFRVVEFAAKFAALQIEDPKLVVPASVFADRMADCLRCFADQDATVVEESLAKQMDKLAAAEPGIQLSALARLGDVPAFWKVLPETLRGLFEARIVQIGENGKELTASLTTAETKMLGLVTYPELRKSLPELETAFAQLAYRSKVEVISLRPDPYYVSFLVDVIGEVHSYDSGDLVTRSGVLPCAPFLNAESLPAVLRAWWDNSQCWGRRVNGVLEQVYEATAHLGPDRDAMWKPFVEELREYDVLYRDILRRFNWPAPAPEPTATSE